MTNERNPERLWGGPADLSKGREERVRADVIIDDDDIRKGGMSEDDIDRNLMGSFPASDPPSWTLGIAYTGPPAESGPEQT